MPPIIRTILCATDFSESSMPAFELAAQFARTFCATIHLVHVHDLRAYSMPDGALFFSDSSMLARIDDEIHRALTNAAQTATDVRVTTQLVNGIPHREIARLARELPAELIVMGTQGRSGLSRLLIGSVAEGVVRASPVPVITVPPASSTT